MQLVKPKLLTLCGVLALAGCVTPQHQYTATGAAIGGIAGAVLGHQIDDDNGRYAGAAAGALLGAAIGNNADAIHNRGYRSDYGYRQPQPYREDYRYDGYRRPYSGGYVPYPPRQYSD